MLPWTGSSCRRAAQRRWCDEHDGGKEDVDGDDDGDNDDKNDDGDRTETVSTLKGGDLSLRRGADLNYKDKWRNLKKGGPIWRGGSSSGAGPSGSHIHDLDYQPILRHLARQASAQGVSSAPIWPGLPTCSARALY